MTTAETSHAQQLDPVTEQARTKFLEGVAAYDAKNYEEARVAFLQAYSLKRHPAVLLNLGQSEVAAGHYETGGNHLQQFLREHKEATPDQVKAAKDGIAEARKRTGFVVVIVDTDGAVVAVDGKTVGISPLLDPVFIKPGQHEVTATRGGLMQRASVDAKQGVAASVTLSFSATGPLAPVPAPPTPPGGEPGAVPPGGEPAWGTPGYLPPVGPDKAVSTGGKESFGAWIKRRPYIFYSGVGVAGLGFIGTVTFGGLAASADSAAEDVSNQIIQHAATTGDLNGTRYDRGEHLPASDRYVPCGERDNPSSAHSNYRQPCQQLRDNLDAYDTDIALLGVSIGLMAVAVGGTAAAYFIDRKPVSEHAAQLEESGPTFVVAPVVGVDQQGIGIVGTF